MFSFILSRLFASEVLYWNKTKHFLYSVHQTCSMIVSGQQNSFTATSLWSLNPWHFVFWNFYRSWTCFWSCMLPQINTSRSYSPEMSCLVQRAISVSSVYFSIAFNSIIMRRRWLHYQRRVIGPFHQLLATHCANHCSAFLIINRCDLVIKQGDGEKTCSSFKMFF